MAGAAVLAVLGAVGAVAWAADSWFATGTQPAEAVPAEALSYIAVDLDPSGSQKLEALTTLSRLPAFEDLRQADGEDAGADLNRAAFDALVGGGVACPGLDYDEHLASWLGRRAALATVPAAGRPDALVVLQVTDEEAAEAGLPRLADCLSGPGALGRAPGYVVDGEWAVIASRRSVAEDALADAAQSALSDDGDYLTLTGAAGSPGVASLYLAPTFFDVLGTSPARRRALDVDGFAGAAATLRFSGGGVEIETASAADVQDLRALVGGHDAGRLAEAMPRSSGAVAAVDLERGWFDELLFAVSQATGTPSTRLEARLERGSGRDLADDVEDVVGDGVASAIAPGTDLEWLRDPWSSTGEPVVPARFVQRYDAGGPDEARRVERLLGRAAGPEVVVRRQQDAVLAGQPGRFWRDARSGPTLADSPRFRDALPDRSRAGGLLYVDLGALDVADLSFVTERHPALGENLRAVTAAGAAWWLSGDMVRTRIRLVTE